MKKHYIVALFFAGVTGFIFNQAFTSDNGKAGYNGSPGEGNCTSCHSSFALNSGGGSIAISCATMTNWEYQSGVVYPMTLTITKAGVSHWGFSCEALRSTGANGGAITVTNTAETKLLTAPVGGNSRTNLVHKLLTSGASPKTIGFNWTAPTTNQGNITFYAVGNAANANGSSSGDYIYTTSQVVIPNTTGMQEVVNNAEFNVYPNPTSNFINLTFSNSKSEDLKIETYTIDGRFMELLAIETISGGSHSYSFNLNHAYATGIYLVKMTIGNSVGYKKIMINN